MPANTLRPEKPSLWQLLLYRIKEWQQQINHGLGARHCLALTGCVAFSIQFGITAATFAMGVSNSGVEIPTIECDRIFDKFYRIPNNDTWKHEGTGLGLTLVQKLAERLGATIHVASRDNQTTFSLEFPDVENHP